jgi:hypothetical protein
MAFRNRAILRELTEPNMSSFLPNKFDDLFPGVPGWDGETFHPKTQFRQIVPIGETKTNQLIQNRTLETVKIGSRLFIKGSSIRKLLAEGAK